MIEVKFYSAEGAKAESVYRGSIVLNDKGVLEARPANPKDEGMLNFIMDDAYELPNGKQYDPQEDPEGWINNLHASYRAYSLLASKPETINVIKPPAD